MASFNVDVDKFVKKTGLRAETVMRKIALDGLTAVMRISPVDTGRFRGNWNVGINQTDLSTKGAPASPPGPSGTPVPPTGADIAAANSKLQQAKWGDTIIISNNLEYALFLEYGGSQQAPNGVLAVAFDLLKTNLAAVIRTVP